MTIEIGGGGLPPVYPIQPPPDPSSGEGEPSGSTEGSSGSGGPDAVYEPGAPEDGEPLTYSFPSGATSSGTGEDGAGEVPPEETGSPLDGGEPDPYVQGASGDDAVDPYASASAGDGGETSPEDVSPSSDGPGGDPYSDYDATDGGDGSFDYDASGNGSDDGSVDPYAEGGSEDGGVDPYAAQPGNDSSDPYGDYFDYGDGETDPYADGTPEDGAIDPETGLPEDGDGTGNGEIGDDEEQAPIAVQQPAGQDSISAAGHRDALAQAAAAAEAARPSLSAALGQGQTHSSLAQQIQAFAPIQPRPVRQVRQQSSQQAGKLAAAIQDAAAQARTSKGRATLMAQAAYAMIGDVQRLDRSKLSLIDKLG